MIVTNKEKFDMLMSYEPSELLATWMAVDLANKTESWIKDHLNATEEEGLQASVDIVTSKMMLSSGCYFTFHFPDEVDNG